ncbi:hypothetical protein O6H91_01G066700 [Diphasiastrum complanatum]|uniref:Uncharacterized protein n=1 Tax=Diphasiastrum complanatum TaxID=34168 RepID=A0ACC2ERV6_DIPCM|nr:hypothetical protein O6H91_Y506300 [Diphasiastrum complanatum]KAJ7569205.1 hypothetical protein O6H91_01G066700 [Diphasiastrum complanatum]
MTIQAMSRSAPTGLMVAPSCCSISGLPFASVQFNFGASGASHCGCSRSGKHSILPSLGVMRIRTEVGDPYNSAAHLNERPDIWMQDFQVPREWATPSAAVQEADWLRSNVRDWLDNEYCPEPANKEISERCARVYHECLLENKLDIGDILIHICSNLEKFSFKESFHGPFSSANAAVDLIMQRVRSFEEKS